MNDLKNEMLEHVNGGFDDLGGGYYDDWGGGGGFGGYDDWGGGGGFGGYDNWGAGGGFDGYDNWGGGGFDGYDNWGGFGGDPNAYSDGDPFGGFGGDTYNQPTQVADATGGAPSATPEIVDRDIQTFDDGSTLTTATLDDGGQFTYATDAPPNYTGTTTQTFDDGSTLNTGHYDDGSSYNYATNAPPDYTGTTTQTFDDGSTLDTYHYNDGSTLPGGSQPALEYQQPDGGNIYDATTMSPAQVNALEGQLADPNLHPDTRREIEGALDAYRTGHDPLLDEGPLAPTQPYPQNPAETGFG